MESKLTAVLEKDAGVMWESSALLLTLLAQLIVSKHLRDIFNLKTIITKGIKSASVPLGEKLLGPSNKNSNFTNFPGNSDGYLASVGLQALDYPSNVLISFWILRKVGFWWVFSTIKNLMVPGCFSS